MLVEIHVPGHINFKWNHSNLDNGRALGRAAAEQAIKRYEKEKGYAPPEATFHKRESRGGRRVTDTRKVSQCGKSAVCCRGHRNWSSKAFACFRSCVSKPSVNQA